MTMVPSTLTDQQSVYEEPVLDLANIQGNVVAGFKKPYQTLLYVHIDEAGKFKPAVAELGTRVATSEAVRTFNLLYKQLRHGDTESITATWMNIAFSFAGIMKLTEPRDTVFFADQAFRAGFAEKVKDLDTSTWKALDGNEDRAADVLIIVAADKEVDAEREVADIKAVINNHGGATVVAQDDGCNPPTMAGKEHFGYRDGISQPGLRGRAKASPGGVLTPLDPNRGMPGQELIWPGEFVFGYQGQVGSPDGYAPGGDSRYNGVGSLQVPEEWGKDGSYLVFRRFNQEVYQFHQALHEKSKAQGKGGKNEDFHGSRIVGRWRSGAPIIRAIDQDNDALGKDDNANNYFAYRAPIEQSGKGRRLPDDYPPDRADDSDGRLCPLSAHIRRANPRDDVALTDRRQRRLLRRGILFGEPSNSTPQEPAKDKEERGLLFLAYMTSIDRQFEGVSTGWASQETRVDGVDTDALLGGPRLDGPRWISLTGGGNYFAPSISAMEQLWKQ
jgi:Dyp-type peroxidase family